MWKWNNNYKIPDKPETVEEKIDMLWDAFYNRMLHWMGWQELRMKFVLVFLGLLLAAFGILIASKFV